MYFLHLDTTFISIPPLALYSLLSGVSLNTIALLLTGTQGYPRHKERERESIGGYRDIDICN